MRELLLWRLHTISRAVLQATEQDMGEVIFNVVTAVVQGCLPNLIISLLRVGSTGHFTRRCQLREFIDEGEPMTYLRGGLTHTKLTTSARLQRGITG